MQKQFTIVNFIDTDRTRSESFKFHEQKPLGMRPFIMTEKEIQQINSDGTERVYID